MVAVLDADDNVIAWVDEHTARGYLSSGRATLERVKPMSRALRAITSDVERRFDSGSPWTVNHQPSPFDRLAAKQRKSELARCQRALDSHQRRLLRMRYHRGLPFRQIALAFQVTEEAALQMHGRLLVKLKAKLAERKIFRLREIL